MDHHMSFTHRLIFDPLDGSFRLTKIPTVTLGGSGVSVTSGVLSLPSGTEVECTVQVTVTNSGGIEIESGSTLLVI